MSDDVRIGVMILIVAVGAVFLLATYPAQRRHWERQAERKRRELQPLATVEDEHLARLLREGVTEDYDRLRERGVDLRGLGYRPPDAD